MLRRILTTNFNNRSITMKSVAIASTLALLAASASAFAPPAANPIAAVKSSSPTALNAVWDD
jgi:hypothetical protein